MCKEYCNLKGKAKVEGCNDEEYEEFYSLVYGHKGNHNCGNKYICKETCSKNCNNKCKLLYGHTPEIHDWGDKTHLYKKNVLFYLYQEIVMKHAEENMAIMVIVYAIYKNKNIFVIKNVICLIVIIKIMFWKLDTKKVNVHMIPVIANKFVIIEIAIKDANIKHAI